MPSIATVKITDTVITLRVPYEPSFLDQLKTFVPSWGRKWQPESKAWAIDTAFRTLIVGLCDRFFDQIIIDDQRTRPQGNVVSDDWAVSLFADVPEHLHDPLYRSLVKVLHPDIGGDLRAMQKLTAAYDKRGAA